MLITSFVVGIAEGFLAQLPRLDDSFLSRSEDLQDKRLAVNLTTFGLKLTFCFTVSGIRLLGEFQDDADCRVTTSLDVLKQLQDPSQITPLIRSGQLQLDGDIHVAQQFATLLKETEIDWAEHLSRFFGDGMAQRIVNAANKVIETFTTGIKTSERAVTEFAQDEAKLSPHPLEAQSFSEEVSAVAANVDKLAARIAAYEQMQNKG